MTIFVDGYKKLFSIASNLLRISQQGKLMSMPNSTTDWSCCSVNLNHRLLIKQADDGLCPNQCAIFQVRLIDSEPRNVDIKTAKAKWK